MKEEFSTSENKATTLSKSPVPGTRARASRTKECPRAEPVNGVSPGLKLRPKPVSPEPNTIPKPGRSILPSKMRPGGDEVGAPGEREMEDPKIVVRTGNRAVEHYARMRRRSDSNFKGVEVDGKTSEWQQRLEASESLVNRLQSEMLMMKAQLERMHSHNLELEAHKKQLTESLLAAQAKISGYERRDQLINQLEAQKKQLTDNLLAAQAKISAYEKRSQVINHKMCMFVTGVSDYIPRSFKISLCIINVYHLAYDLYRLFQLCSSAVVEIMTLLCNIF